MENGPLSPKNALTGFLEWEYGAGSPNLTNYLWVQAGNGVQGSMRHEKEVTPPSQTLISVGELAKHLSVKPGSLYKEIEEHGWREEQGVFQILPGKRGLRIDEYTFLHWRRLPVALLGDAHVRDVSKSLLAMLYPMRNAIDQAIASCSRLYDDSAQKVQDGEEAVWPDGEEP